MWTDAHPTRTAHRQNHPVTADSAAAKAGIKVGDVVTKFGDYAISDPNQLTAAVREQPAGAKVKVTIERNGQSQEVDVTLDAAK